MTLKRQRLGGLAMLVLAAAIALGGLSAARALNPNWRDGTWQSCYYIDQAQHNNGSGPVYSWAETEGSSYCTDYVAVSHWAWNGGAYQHVGSSGWRAGYEYTQYNVSFSTTLIDCYHQVEVNGLQQSPNVNYQAT